MEELAEHPQAPAGLVGIEPGIHRPDLLRNVPAEGGKAVVVPLFIDVKKAYKGQVSTSDIP
jgi:hypothetical protein